MINSIQSNKGRIFTFKYIISTFFIFILGFMFLKFPEATGQGISDGIDLCLGTLIPSLLPFLVISSLTVNLNTFKFFTKVFSKATNLLFRLPGKCLGVILMSMVGGYPVGSKMIYDLYACNEITLMQGKRLLLFCINPAPAFVISSVGFYMLGSKKAGVIIYLSVILSSFLLGFILRFFENEETATTNNFTENNTNSFSNEIVRSVLSSGKSMLFICIWVVLFSAISRLIDIIPFTPGFRMFLCCTLEVTNGCYLASGNLALPVIACIIGFGGICTHFQVVDTVRALKLRYKYFIISRIIHGALSAVICNLMLRIYPVSYDVFSVGTLPTVQVSSASYAFSVSMAAMCALIMLGEQFYIKINQKKQVHYEYTS